MNANQNKYPPLAIKKIANIIALKDVYDPNYLKGPQLVEIFQSLGFPDDYSYVDGKGIQTIDYGDGLSRLAYTNRRLEELNKSFQIPSFYPLFMAKIKMPDIAFDAIQDILSTFHLTPLSKTEENTKVLSVQKKEEKDTSTVKDLINEKNPTSLLSSEEDLRKTKFEQSILGEIPPNRPVVFISYSWDTEIHKKWVVKLATDLTRQGIYVLLDQFLEDGTQLPTFMSLGIERADKVLVIGSENYKKRSCYSDSGAAFEGCIIKNSIFSNLGTKKFVTCLRQGDFHTSFPILLSGGKGHDFRDDNNYEKELEELCRDIWQKPKVFRPQLGEIPNYVK